MAGRFDELSAPVQAAILIIAAVGLAFATFWYFVYPLNQKRNSLEQQVSKLKAENDRNEAFRQQQTEYLNRIAQLEKQLETLRSIVPDEANTDEFMRTVFSAGTMSGINIRTFIPKPQATSEYYIEMPFSLRLDGTYYRLVNFFDRLAHEQRIMSVSGLTLGSPEGGGMGNYKILPDETVGANCVLTTYFNRPLQAAQPPQKKK
jgi:type IV pilus assembly protein PilO